MQYESGLANRLGNRAMNQDRCAIYAHDRCVLVLLADGMGGHEGGELASQQFIDSMKAWFETQPEQVANPKDALSHAIYQAHEDIVNLGLQHRPPIFPRTTCIACLVQSGRAWWTHVGDSRLYHLRGSQVLSRTRDHTYIEELLRQQIISEDEMATHPMRNYVSRCLGGPDTPAELPFSENVVLQNDDVLLLCSDGLWSAEPIENHGEKLTNPELDMEQSVDQMAALAEENSYPHSDNVSVAAIRVRFDEEELRLASEVYPESAAKQPHQPPELNDAIDIIRQAVEDFENKPTEN